MFQQKFSDDYKSIVDDIFYWKNEKDIPNNIKTFIKEKSNYAVVHSIDTNKFYCGKCLCELDDCFFCSKCSIKHKNFKNYKDYDDYTEIRDLKVVDSIKNHYSHYCDFYCNYYAFDVIGDKVILYLLKEHVIYDNPVSISAYKCSEISVSKIYLVEDLCVYDVFNNRYYNYEVLEFDDIFNTADVQNSKEFDEYLDTNDFFYSFDAAYLYTDNLYILDNTIYKYSKFSKVASYLNNDDIISLTQLTYFPIYCKSFEYLINFKLYNLAFNSANQFKNGKNFKEIFGIDKKYLSFMVKNDISYDVLSSIKLYPTEDFEIINFIKEELYTIHNLVNKFKINIKSLKNYFDKKNLLYSHITEYYDYLTMAKEMGFNCFEKSVLFPDDLLDLHNELYSQIEIIKDPDIDIKIRNLASLLSFNYYDDQKYIIFPASSIKSLVDESSQQNNCVRAYSSRISSDKSQIYFMREKNNISKSFVTIEVRDNKVVQAREKFNKNVNDDVLKIIKKWEKSLLPILSEN